jgi:hypothetical protein
MSPSSCATRLLIRASLDLRGVRPSVAELEAVEAEPSQLDGLIADFLYDERFADQIVALYAEIYQTQFDTPLVGYGDKTSDYPRMVASMGQEPLRILAHIADHDLPYTEGLSPRPCADLDHISLSCCAQCCADGGVVTRAILFNSEGCG